MNASGSIFKMFAVAHIKCSHSARQLLRDDVSFLAYVTHTVSNSKKGWFYKTKAFTVVKKNFSFILFFLFFQYVYFFFLMQFSFFRKFPCYVKGYISQYMLLTFKLLLKLLCGYSNKLL